MIRMHALSSLPRPLSSLDLREGLCKNDAGKSVDLKDRPAELWAISRLYVSHDVKPPEDREGSLDLRKLLQPRSHRLELSPLGPDQNACREQTRPKHRLAN